MIDLLRRWINSPTPARRNTCVLRLERLEAREVPSIPDTPFGIGNLMKGGVHSFPAKAKDLPSGTMVEIYFGGSKDTTGQFKASVTLKDPKGAAVRSNPSFAPIQSEERLAFAAYTITAKTSGQFTVDVKNAGKVIEGSYPYWGTAKIKLPDITVSGAKYFGGSEKDHKNPTGVEVTFKVSGGDPSKFQEKFKIGLYRSTDGKTPGSKLAETEVSGAGQTIKLDTKSPLQGRIHEPYLVVVADNDKKVEEDNEGNNSTKLDLPPIGVMIDPGKNGLTLMDNETFTVTTGGVAASGFRIELRQRGQADTDYTIVAGSSASKFTVIPRLADKVDYLPSAIASGVRFYGATHQVTVQFPELTTIAADTKVVQAAQGLWNQTKTILTSSNGQNWRELGAYIYLDTSTGTYSFGPTSTGPLNSLINGIPTTATVSVVGPGDQVNTTNKSGIYYVAWFHTHPQDHWRASPLFSRGVGPSTQDVNTSNTSGIPGLVFDYVGQQMTVKDPRTGKVINSGILVHTSVGVNANASLYQITGGPARRRT